VKLTKAQQEIVDVLRSGGKLEKTFAVRSDGVWKLRSDSTRDKTVSASTIKVLEKAGLIVYKTNYPKWPLRCWYQYTPPPPASPAG